MILLIKVGCPYDKEECRRVAEFGGECTRKVLEWLDDETSDTS